MSIFFLHDYVKRVILFRPDQRQKCLTTISRQGTRSSFIGTGNYNKLQHEAIRVRSCHARGELDGFHATWRKSTADTRSIKYVFAIAYFTHPIGSSYLPEDSLAQFIFSGTACCGA